MALGFILIGAENAQAAVTVTAATGGSAISADNTGATWTTLTGLVLDESTGKEIGTGTIILNVPSGFVFDTASTVTSIVTRISGTGTALTLSSSTTTPTSSTITFTVSAQDSTGSTLSRIAFSNIRVRPSAGTPLASGNLTKTGGSTYTPSSTNYGTLTEVAGAANAAHSTVSPAAASIAADGSSTQTVTVQARDQFNNNRTTGGATVLMSKTGGGTLSSVTDNANGTYTATLTSPTTTGSATVTATLGGVSVGTSVSATSSVVTFTPGPANAAHSTMSPATASITANGSSTQVITVQARDVNNNNLTTGGATVLMSKSGGGTLSSVTDNGNGTYTATLTSPTATGSATVTATLGGTAVGTAVGASSSVVTFTPGAVNAAHSTLSPGSASITADGSSSQTITVQARDVNNNTLTTGGATVAMNKVGGGTLSSVTDNGNGTYTATLISPTSTGSATVTATLGGTAVGTAVSASSSVVTFTPGAANAAHSTIGPATASITADGSSTQVLTVQARDVNNNNLTTGGATVAMNNVGGGTLSSVTDNGNGTYTATLTSPTSTGSATVTATLGGTAVGTAVSASSSVVAFTPGASNAAHSTIGPATASITADGSSTQVITVQARDVNNNNLTTGGATVLMNKVGGGTFSSVTDIGNGTYTATLTSPTSTGSATVTASLGGVSVGTAVGASSSVVTFTPGAANAAHSTISPATASITADGSSTQVITVQARDVNNNNLTTGGATVAMSTTAGTLSSLTDNGNGTYTATLTSPTTTGSATVTATLGGLAVGTAVGASSSVVTFTPGALDRFVFGAIATQTAGTAFSITVTAEDANNNTVTGFTGTVDLTTTAGTIAPTISGAFVLGVRTESVTVTLAGANKTITATDHGGTGKTGTSAAFTVGPGTANAAHSTISPATASLTADGSSTQVITVQARDLNNNNLTTGGATVAMSATAGTLSGVSDNGNGTYSATLTSPTTAGSATVTATLGGTAVGTAVGASSAVVTFTAGATTKVRVETAVDGSGTIVPAQDLASGSALTAFAIARDQFNNFVANVPADVSGWSLVNQTGGVVDGDLMASLDRKSAVFSGHVIGSAEIHVVSGSLTSMDSGTITVVPGAVSNLVVTLPGQTFNAGSGNSGTPNAQTAGVAFDIVRITATDSSFNIVTSYTGTKTLSYSGPGTAPDSTVPSYTTSVEFDAGQSTNTLATTLSKAETTTITVTDGSTSGPASSSLTVVHGAAARFVIVNPTDGTVDAPITVTVQLQDQFGNLVTTGLDADKDVMLNAGGSASGAGLVDIVNGVGTRSISDQVAQTVNLSLTDSQATGFNVSSVQDVVFAHGAATKFVILNPLDGTVDAPVLVTVQLQDQFGNLVTSGPDKDKDVTLNSSGSATGGGLVDIVNGVGTRSISDPVPQTVNLSLNDTQGTGFNVTSVQDVVFGHGAATKFVILNPLDGTVDAPITVTVQLQDQFGNLVTSGPDKDKDVTLNAGGSATGAGLVDIVNGVGTKSISDQLPETVSLSLSDTQGTGFNVSSAQDVIFAHGAAAKFVILNPADGTVDAPVLVTVQLQDQFGNVVSSGPDKDKDVMLNTSGSATGGGLVDIVNGVGTKSISDQLPETVSLSLSDTQGTGFNVSSVQDVVFGSGVAGAYRITAAATTPVAGASDALTIRLVDQFGNTVTSFSGDKTLTFGGLGAAPGGQIPTVTDKAGSAVALGTGTTITLTNGVSSAGGALVAYKAEGPVTLTATDGSLSTSGTGGSGATLTVTHNVGAQFVIVNPTDGTVDAPVVVTVQLKDQFGNVVTSGPDKDKDVTLNISGSATGGGVVDIVDGVGTKSISDQVPETVSLSLSDSEGTGFNVGSVQDVVFAHGAATKFVILNPTDGTVDAPITVTVQLQDQFGNVVTSGPDSGRDVTLNTSGSATGGGLVDIVNGVGTKSISDQLAQTVNLNLSDSQGTGFDVSSVQDVIFAHGVVTKLQILLPGEAAAPGTATGKTGTPNVQSAGNIIANGVVVNAVDAFWNLVNTATPNVTITSSDTTAAIADDNGATAGNITLVAGTAALSGFTFRTAGTRSITATDAGGPLTANTSANVSVGTGAFTKLQLLVPGETAAPGTATGKTGTPSAQTAGAAFAVTVNAVDADWNVVGTVTDTVGITSSDSNATLPANAALASGTGTFNVTLKTAGSRTVTATDSTDGTKTANTTPAIPVNAGAFTELQLLVPGETATPGAASGKTGTPIAQTAGTPFTVTVNAVDANWNPVSSTHTVGITSSDGNATLPANAALVAGTQTFSVTLKTAGSRTVTATDITDGSKTANTSPAIAVNAGAFVKLQLLVPGETAAPGSVSGKTGTPTARTAGTAFTAAVNAVDADWNLVNTVTDTVGITSSDVNATLPANAALVGGTQSFNVTLNTAGSRTLTATDGTDGAKTANTSPAILVNPGAFVKLQLLVPGETAAPGTGTGKTGTPAAQTAGSASTVTVNAVDANWNLVSSTHTVGITSSDANATLPVNAALVAGTKTFSVTLNTAGSRTVTASDITDGTKSANTSPSITVNAGAFAKLQLLVPGETAAPGTATGKAGTPNSQTAATLFTVTINAVDANWNPVNTVSDTVGITSSDANAVLPANAALVAGTKTFSVTLKTGGSRTVTATDVTDGSKAANTSPAISVNAGAFAKLQTLLPGETAAPGTATGKTGTPTAQTAGTSFSVTVNAVDADWNLVSAATDTVGITSSDSNATLPSNAPLVAGTRNFTVTLNTAGSRTVTATDISDGSKAANTSSPVSVNAGAFVKLQLLVPGETAAPGSGTGKTGTPIAQTAGTPFTVTVNAVDANWNPVSSTHTVGTTSSDVNATLPSNAALVAGTQTFSVTLKTAGSRTVTATDITDGTKTANTSPAIAVNAGAFTKLQILAPGEAAAPGTATGKAGSPTAQTAGTAFNVTVNAVDANWNLVSSTDTVGGIL